MKRTLLNRLSVQYNNCTIDAYLQPNKGIHPFKMEKHDEISFISWESTNRAKETTVKYQRKLHSKLFWFDAGEDQYCLLGSPNATIAALERKLTEELMMSLQFSLKCLTNKY